MKSLSITAVLLCALAVLCVQANSSEDLLDVPRPEPKSNSASYGTSDEEAVQQQNWSDEMDACPKDMYLKYKKCRPCSQCGPDLYVRERCATKKDTVCDWCLNPNPLKNSDFHLKCTDMIQLQEEFRQLLGQREDSFKSAVVKPIYVEHQPQQSLRFTRLSLNTSYKIEMIMEACFYLALIALIFVVIRFISKSKPYYRTVTVNPPVLDESDTKNIIRAADHIRAKLGKKGYERLEEFI